MSAGELQTRTDVEKGVIQFDRMEPTELARLRLLAGKQTTRLTHYGRKTGKPYEVTIWFVLDGNRLYIGTANAKRQWVQNVQKAPHIKMAIGNEHFVGTARFLNDRSEHECAMAAIRRKYWIFRPILEVGRILAAIRLMPDKTGSFEITLESKSNAS
jgi:deazaflavin-dependent oxidoreductase (nitroreductase family)